jgi:hypothetical protein
MSYAMYPTPTSPATPCTRGAAGGRLRNSTPTVLAATGVCLAAVLPFLPTLSGYFLSDDFGLVQLFSHKPTLHFLSLFTRPWTEAIYGVQPDELRPLLALSYQVDSLWGVENPTGYHISNVVLHTLNAVLVLAIARAAGLSLPAATFAGVLFSVLPIHAETVAWISGRADSILALFYLLSFLAYAAWRRSNVQGPALSLPKGPWTLYALSLGVFFLALFSKQSAITMLAALLMYDLLIERRRLERSWACLWPYLPFACLTVGYVGLRYFFFGNAVREHQLTPETLLTFVVHQGMFLKTLAVGSSLVGVEGARPELESAGLLLTWVAIGVALTFVVVQVRRTQTQRTTSQADRPTDVGSLLYFGPIWWLLSIAPLVVTYISPRHLYLASAGAAVALGALFNILWAKQQLQWRSAAALGATALVVASTLTLEQPVSEWRWSAALSATISQDIVRELSSTPSGSLLIISPPVAGASKELHTWVWMWASPFALHPPFMPAGLVERVIVIEPPDVYCCPRDQWLGRTRRALAAWLSRSDQPPVIMLRWDVVSGALSRKSELDDEQFRGQVAALAEAETFSAMCRRLEALVGDLGGSCDPE